MLSGRQLLSLLQRSLTFVVLGVSGFYLVVYLYRWEWNRAIVSGLFFVSAEIGLATSMILRRLRALEQQRTVSPAEVAPTVLDRIRAAPVDRPNPFRWLSPRNGGLDRLGVFVPVLLGAGAVLSALAYVVERIAEATAMPVADRHLADRMSALAPPPGGLTGRAVVPVSSSRARRGGTGAGAVIALASVVVLGWLAIDALMDAAQTRPEHEVRPASTTIELEIVERRNAGQPDVTAAALWVGCRWTVSRNEEIAGEVVPQGGNRVDLVLRPGIGNLATRRLTGCLSDLKVDLVRADVLDVDHEPPA